MSVTVSHQPPSSYYQHIRNDIIKHITSGSHRVMDVGCAAGFLGEYLKKNGFATEVVGIEIDPQVAKDASGRIDRVFCANLNRVGADELLSKEAVGKFDYIVCADVLEHLVDPWQSLKELVEYLTPDGKIIISLPNVRHWSVWFPLIFRGKWEYRESGILDKTHLRFFTQSSASNLLNNAGLEITECQQSMGGLSRLLNIFTMTFFSELLGSQCVFVAKKLKIGSQK